jgi:subtilase family serine protease
VGKDTSNKGDSLRKLLIAALAAAVTLVLAVAALAANVRANYHAVCPAGADAVRCHAQVTVDAQGNPNVSSTPYPSALKPQDLSAAYNLPSSSAGGGQTIAVVDAYDYPAAENDLNVWSKQYGLPACTTANGCFRRVNQNGGSSFGGYRTDAGWTLEAAMDLQTVHGLCPNCKILFVEGKTASISNLATAVNTAAGLGANVISNSYGAPDSSSLTAYNSYYNHPGVAVTVSTGDNGYEVQWPASAPTTVAVGGTTLTRDSSARGWSETAWSGAGSGCSTVQAKPTWQTSATSCSRKATADVSADADPNSGMSVYDSTRYNGASGWYQVGGTSLAAPIIAAVYGLAGNASSTSTPAALPWSHASSLNDVTSGSNGSCPTAVWCRAGAGWDGPTGLGTPNGVGGF